MAAAGAPGASSQHFDSHSSDDTVATLKAQHQEAYTLLYERYVLLDSELSAAKSKISKIQELCQANTDTHMSARPSCSACDTYASSSCV